jgi:hypothetical protein
MSRLDPHPTGQASWAVIRANFWMKNVEWVPLNVRCWNSTNLHNCDFRLSVARAHRDPDLGEAERLGTNAARLMAIHLGGITVRDLV